MTPLVPLALFGWIPAILLMFAKLQAHRAAIAGFLLAWMFLPWHIYELSGLPNYTRVSATCMGMMLGIFLFDQEALRRLRFRLVDIPAIGLCVVPFFTSVANGLGAYDGLSAFLDKALLWGIPWLVGRLYLSHPDHMRDMVFGIFLGGLVYVPLVIFEFIMSPRLHRIVYGFHAHSFAQAKRGDGYRPVVFMNHGLMTAMWLMSATFCGVVMTAGGYFKSRFPRQAPLLYGGTALLFLITAVNRSVGAFFLLIFAIGIFMAVRILRQRWPLLITILLAVLYMVTRGTGTWDAENLIEQAERVAGPDRAGSLEFRINMETMLAERAMERPWLGWGRWRRSFVKDEDGNNISVPDGLWILAFGQEGLLGVAFLTLTLSIPIVVFLRRFPPRTWHQPEIAALTALPILLGIYLIDNLLNNMFNPAFLLVAGGLAGATVGQTAATTTAQDAPVPLNALQPARTRAL
jgi:hypothetical protein